MSGFNCSSCGRDQLEHLLWLTGTKLTEEQRRAMRYLVSRGKKFLVDFGWQNAEDLARDDWRQRRREYRQKARHS